MHPNLLNQRRSRLLESDAGRSRHRRPDIPYGLPGALAWAVLSVRRLCGMTLIGRHGYGTMLFASVCHPGVSDDEARVLNLFAGARADDPALIRIASSLVSEDMAIQLAGAAARLGAAMRLPT